MKRMSRKATPAVFGFSFLAALAASAAVIPQDRPPAGLQHIVNVGMKLVQVFVTDRAGRPVTDLRAEDFTVFDNGVPQPLAAFEVHASKPDPGPVPSTASAGSAAVDTPRIILFLFDYFMNDPQGIHRAKTAALEFVDKKAKPGDRIGVLSYTDIDGFEVLLDPTTDHPRARKIVTEMKGVPRLKSSSEVYFIHGAPAHEKYHIYEEVRLYIRSLEDLAKSLREIEGFKNVLFFSRGLSMDVFLDDDDFGLSLFDQYQSMLDELAQSQSPIFAVNTLGIRGPMGAGGQRFRGVEALVGLSKATGGSYFPTGDYAKRLSESIDLSTSNYYILGYRLDPNWHGRFHELKVVVNRPGCEIRMPRGYYNPKAFTDFSLGEKHGQLQDLAQGKESPFLVPYEIPLVVLPIAAPAAGRNADCLILCDLAAPELRDLAGSSSEIALFIFKENGEMSGVRMADFSFADWKGVCLCPYFAESLPPGKYEAGIVLRNLDTGMAAVGRTSFSSPEPRNVAGADADKARLELDPPLLLRPETATNFYKLSGTPGKTRSFSIKDLFPFVSTSTGPVLGILDADPSPVQAVVRAILPSEDPDISWSAAFIRSQTAEEIPLETEEIASQEADGATAFLLSIERPKLAPGAYLLRLNVVENSSGRKAGVEIPIVIR